MDTENKTLTNNHIHDDEIDLYELWQTLWSQKWLIAAITLVTTFGAGLVAFNINPTYEAKTHLMPPKTQYIGQLNFQNIGGVSYQTTPNEVFRFFTNQLLSYENKRAFFEQENLLDYFKNPNSNNSVSSDLKAFDKFVDSIKFTAPNRNSQIDTSTLSIQYTDAHLSAAWLNRYIEFTLLRAKSEKLSEISTLLENQRNRLVAEEEVLLNQAKANRQHQITVLSEALKIAEKANIIEPAINQQTLSEFPQYLKGTKLLASELEMLKARASDEAFIPRIQDIRHNILAINSHDLNQDQIQLAVIDRKAEVPLHPIKPNKKLIVAVALVLGGMLGIFIALVRGAVRKRQTITANQTPDPA